MNLDTIGSTSAAALEPALTVLERLWRSVTMEFASWVVVRAMTSFLNCLCSVMYNNMDDSLTMILSDIDKTVLYMGGNIKLRVTCRESYVFPVSEDVCPIALFDCPFGRPGSGSRCPSSSPPCRCSSDLPQTNSTR